MPLLSTHCVPQDRVCDLTHEGHRHLLEDVSSNIIPSLLLISECFLFITFLLHIIVPEFRKQIFGWMKMCTVVCLFMGYLWFLIVIMGGNSLLMFHSTLCQVVGLLMQFCFLSSFCWMSAMAWEVWATFRQFGGISAGEARHKRQKSRFFFFNICCWGLPLMVTTVTIIIHLLPEDVTEDLVKPGLGEDSCFFSGYPSQLLYFHGVIAVILLVNLVLFLSSAYSLLFGIWAPAREDVPTRQNIRQMFWIVLELFLVMGLTWLADVASLFINWYYGGVYAGYEILAFDIINSLQGLLIFLVLICKPRMRSIIRSSLQPTFSSLCHCLPHTKSDTVDGPREKQGSPLTPITKTSTISHRTSQSPTSPESPFYMESPSSITTASTATVPRTPTSRARSRSPRSPWTYGSPGSPGGHTSELISQSTSRRGTGILDTLTPGWKRGSYNLGFHDSPDDSQTVTTLSLHESRC